MTHVIPDNKPSEVLRIRILKYLGKQEIRVTQVASDTGIGYFKLLRWIKGGTAIISYNDAVKLEEYLSRD